MSDTPATLRQKTRELHNHHMDSRLWEAFDFRDAGVIAGTYGKGETTWTQQVVARDVRDVAWSLHHHRWMAAGAL